MVTVGYNPSTGKALWGTGGALCLGCCWDIEACSRCETLGRSTPHTMEVEITSNPTGSYCHYNGVLGWLKESNFDFLGTYTLTQIEAAYYSNCIWNSGAVPTTYDHYNCDTDCGSCTFDESRSIDSVVSIYYLSGQWNVSVNTFGPGKAQWSKVSSEHATKCGPVEGTGIVLTSSNPDLSDITVSITI